MYSITRAAAYLGLSRSTVNLAEQLTEDMMMLIASFSGKYYQARSYKLRNQWGPELKSVHHYVEKFDSNAFRNCIKQTMQNKK